VAGLGQFLSIRLDHERQVQVSRYWQLQRLQQCQLPRGAVEQVGTANYIRDALIGIVDHHRELIGKYAIATAHNHIAVHPWLEANLAESSVLDARGVKDAEVGAQCRIVWIASKPAALTDTAGFTLRRQHPAAAPAMEQGYAPLKLRQCVLVALEPAALTPRRLRPLEAECRQRSQNRGFGLGTYPRDIEILDA
jgi:hypothetical protein